MWDLIVHVLVPDCFSSFSLPFVLLILYILFSKTGASQTSADEKFCS